MVSHSSALIRDLEMMLRLKNFTSEEKEKESVLIMANPPLTIPVSLRENRKLNIFSLPQNQITGFLVILDRRDGCKTQGNFMLKLRIRTLR